MFEDMSFPALSGGWDRAVQVAGKVLLSLCMLAQCTGAPGSATGEAAPLIDPTVRAAVAAGQARVIIELRITPAWKPEGDLPGPAAVEAQRKAIETAQAALRARLLGTKFSVSHQYDGLPFMALEIGSDALGRIEAAGDVVTRVAPDGQGFPQR